MFVDGVLAAEADGDGDGDGDFSDFLVEEMLFR